MLRILIVSQYFWPEAFRINDIAKGLKSNGHDVTVLTGIPNYPKGAFFSGYHWFKKNNESYEGISIKRVPLVSRGKGGSLRLILNYFSFAFFASLLGPFRCKEKYDVILVFMPSPVTVGLPALLLKKLKKIPILFWVQDLWPEALSATGAIRSPRILRWVETLTKYIYQGCDRILVQSRAFIPSIEKLGILASKIYYLPNPVENLYRPITDIEKHANPIDLPTGFKVLYAGNIGVAQSFETILNAADILRDRQDIHWVIIGDGRQKSWLKEQIIERRLEKTVHLIDHKSPEMMPYYFGHADALLVSLKKDNVFALTIPTKLQSYLACSKPVIASLDGEAARIVEEAKAGLVSGAEDVKKLAENVLTMYNTDPQNRSEMGKSGRGYFEKHFAREQLLRQLEGWMIEVRGG